MKPVHTPANVRATEVPADAGALQSPHTIRFPHGIPGFESCRSFVLMTTDGDTPLRYLTAVDGAHASFLVIDPRLVMPDYRCELSETDRLQLAAGESTVLLWLALVTVETDGTVVANLRAPIVINPERMTGQQVIPQHTAYPLRHVLAEPE
jgi:flagellar assembly factor FliW